jgi:hypothetical protein
MSYEKYAHEVGGHLPRRLIGILVPNRVPTYEVNLIYIYWQNIDFGVGFACFRKGEEQIIIQ